MVGYGAAVTEAQTEAIVAFLATDAAPAGGGVDAEAAQAVLNSACATCHDLAGVMPGVYTTAEWRETINRMIGYGASISADDTELIVQYLASDAAPGEAAEVDQAAAQALLDTACATCHDLTAVQPDLYTAAEWSEVIQRMIEYGAAVTADQTELILDYLATDR
jgi:cytochrome c5